MSVPAGFPEAAAWKIVWDDQQLDFVFKPLSPPSGTTAISSASLPDGAIWFNLDTMRQMAEEAREKARENARSTKLLQDFTKYRHEIEALRWPPTSAQHHNLYNLQEKLGRQHPIRICPDRDDKSIPERRSAAMSRDQDKKTTESHEKEQPYLAISTAFDWKVMPAEFFLYRPEAREASMCPDGYPVLHTISDFFELFKTTTAKEAKKKRKKKKKAEATSVTSSTSSSRSVSGNMGSTNEDTGTNNTISGTRVPRLVYIIGRPVICQPHTDEGNLDWVQPTVFVVAIELNKNINNGVSTGKDNNSSTNSRPLWLIRDNQPASLDDDELWELQDAELSMRRLSAIWPMMEGKQAFGAARLADSIDCIFGAEACMSLSEVGANVWNSMDLGSWAMVEVQQNQAWP